MNHITKQVEALSKKYSNNFRFPMPELGFGTMDHLLKASVELERLEASVEAIVSNIVEAYMNVLELKLENMAEYFIVNDATIPEFLYKFKWDLNMFSNRQTIKGIQDDIERQMCRIELETNNLYADYIAARTELKSKELHEKGSLLTRNISEFVKKEDFVLSSHHLITILVVVPKTNYRHWYNTYECLDNEVIPRSTKLLHEDNEFGLFSVTLFKRRLEQFKEKARENSFYVKNFTYNESRILAEMQNLVELRHKKEVLHGHLLRFLKVNFAEGYVHFIHVKTMKVYVECVLRYGPPAKFLGIIMVVSKRNVKKLRELMFKEFAFLDGPMPKKEKEIAIENKLLLYTMMSKDYFPYVYTKINVEPEDFEKQ